jgi:uncharacterized protein
MDITAINAKLAIGDLDQPNVFPQMARLKTMPYVFRVQFGLKELPIEPGILLIRGARQYGKSTWLEQEIYKTIQQFGSGSAYYLNGETIPDADFLEKEMDLLIASFSKSATVRRIFIDEITAIPRWEIALKRMADRGKLNDVLVVTTGSKATDLRRGSEKLPGRKGRLPRTTYLFTPISYREFHRVCHKVLGEKTLLTYLLSGGSPIACSELASTGLIPEFVIELVRDWVEGEIAASGRTRSSLVNIMSVLFRLGGSPIGQAKLSREAGLANNTVASGYMEVLNDLGCIVPSYPWDPNRKILILRKPCKYHFTNVLAAVTYHPNRIRCINDFLLLPEKEQGTWYEWLVAQELLRRTAMEGKDILAPQGFWQNEKHELDFVIDSNHFAEVKRGNTSKIEFGWFHHQFPYHRLTVISPSRFETDYVQGVTLEEFLLIASQ